MKLKKFSISVKQIMNAKIFMILTLGCLYYSKEVKENFIFGAIHGQRFNGESFFRRF